MVVDFECINDVELWIISDYMWICCVVLVIILLWVKKNKIKFVDIDICECILGWVVIYVDDKEWFM